MRTKLYTLLLMIALVSNQGAFAFWGDGGAGWANYAYLIKIYQENLRRYLQLREMMQQARNHESLIRTINAGIDNAMGVMHVLPLKDDRILSQLQEFQIALKKVEELYGMTPKSSNEALHRLHDQTIAESLKLNNVLQEYSVKQERNATSVFIQSRQASPKGAERMNAQMSAQILHSVNQLIKVNGQMLKLQSETLAFNNKRDKDSTAGFNKTSDDFKGSMMEYKPNYSFPRF